MDGPLTLKQKHLGQDVLVAGGRKHSIAIIQVPNTAYSHIFLKCIVRVLIPKDMLAGGRGEIFWNNKRILYT